MESSSDPGTVGLFEARYLAFLEEIADLVDSTVGGVKAALNRGRSKLAKLPPSRARSPRTGQSAEATRLLPLYVERFNRRDWDGLRELITADARVRVADRFAGPLTTSPYFGRYARLAAPWRVALGRVDGEPVIITLSQGHDGRMRWRARMPPVRYRSGKA